MKRRIAEITAELNSGDGSQAYKDCIRVKYSDERENRYRESQGKSKNYAIPTNHEFDSGQPSGATVHSHAFGYSTSADRKARSWLDGRDSTLFNVVEGQHVPHDRNHNGVTTDADDGFTFDLNIVAARPIPVGSYKLNYQLVPFGYVDCGHAFTTALTINVTAPGRTLHEALFDPVTDGSTVAADSTNGILKPASFTGANSASASLQRIEWMSGTVKVKVSPHTGLAGQVIDFIELDGSVSLSLDVADATVDAANHTLSWTVAEQPWHDGDKLMVRIRMKTP